MEPSEELWRRLQKKQRRRIAATTCTWLARQGLLELLQRARAQSPPYPSDETTCGAAAQHGHLQLLQWLREQGCPWDATTCAFAAMGGHIPVLEWLRANHCPWDERACEWAARGGQMATLQWLRKQYPPCPWNQSTCCRAAEQGHLDILQWARNHGCPCGPETGLRAVENGHLHVLQWLEAHDDAEPLPGPLSWFRTAFQQGYWVIAEWMLRAAPHRVVCTPLLVPSRRFSECYQAQRYVVHSVRHCMFSYAWLDAVTDVSRLVLDQVLIPDLSKLIQRYV